MDETFHSCYKIFTSENVTYDEAFQNCENQGTKLTDLQSLSELESMRRKFNVEIVCICFEYKLLRSVK